MLLDKPRANDQHFVSIPYVGAGPLRFGMSPQEVIALLGQPQVVTSTWKKTLAHGYPGLKLVYSEQNRLTECGFDPPLQLIVGGIDVISDMRALQKLAKVDPNPLRHLDTVLFPKLGVLMGVERTPKDCQVAVFAEGALGDLLSEFEPYTQ